MRGPVLSSISDWFRTGPVFRYGASVGEEVIIMERPGTARKWAGFSHDISAWPDSLARFLGKSSGHR